MPKAKRKKQKFIDKKVDRTTTFALVHRSQRDPLAADPDASQRVLQPLNKDPGHDHGGGHSHDDHKKKEEERKWGIFFDDDYDYMQHIKESGRVSYDYSQLDRFEADHMVTKMTFAANNEEGDDHGQGIVDDDHQHVFGSSREAEEEVGLLNRAAPVSGPRLDWDPDIVETLDDDFDCHQMVLTLQDETKADQADSEDGEDDLDAFLREANASPEDDDEDEDESEDESEDEDDEVGSLEGFTFNKWKKSLGSGNQSIGFEDEEETNRSSRFTEYSMSSSVVRRNAQLTLLDDKFDHFFAEYDDSNVGGLECDDIEGSKAEDSALMRMVVRDHSDNAARVNRSLDDHDEVPKKDLRGVEQEEDEEELESVEVEFRRRGESKEEHRMDCQSVISTYSNLYNRPKVIRDLPRNIQPIKVTSKTGIPKNVLGKGLTSGALKRLDEQNRTLAGSEDEEDEEEGSVVGTLASRVSQLSFRNKHETPEERKVRKGLAKELRKERRVEKKANKAAFKDEKKRQDKVDINNRRNAQIGDGSTKKIL